MPELPEVETIKRGLSNCRKRTIRGVTVNDEELLGGELTAEKLSEQCLNERVELVDRVGKYCLVVLNEKTLLFSLRMTGNLRLGRKAELDRKNYVKFKFDYMTLWFTSIRRFSNVHFYNTVDSKRIDKINRLGVDPLKTELNGRKIHEIFQDRVSPIKTALMKQECLAGLGNIYANEICYHTGINPKRKANDLSKDQRSVLARKIPVILRQSIELGGSSIDNFSGADGEEGAFQDSFFVYDREGEPCRKCSTPVRKVKLAGRSTFWCPICQPLSD